MNDTQPCDVFISYSKKPGRTAAQRLEAAFEKRGLRAFRFEDSLIPGHLWGDRVLKQLHHCRCVLVLVPQSRKGLTDYQNHEIGIARAMKKAIIPIALGSDFQSSAPTSDLLSQYWGCPLNKFLRSLDLFISEWRIASAAKLTALWSSYLVSGSARIVVGGYDPTAQNKQSFAGDYFSIGTFRAITRLSCFFSQQFGADFLDELLIAQKTGHEELSRHELIVIGGPKSLHESSLKDCHKNLGIQYDDAEKAYFVGPQRCRVASEEIDGFRKEACVLGFASNPMNLHKEMLLVSGDSGYGHQGAIEYLTDTQTNPELDELAAAVREWRKRPHNNRLPLLFEVYTDFEKQSNTYANGSGVVRQIEINRI